MMGYPRQMVRVESDYFTASSANLQPAEIEQFPAFTNQEEETSGSAGGRKTSLSASFAIMYGFYLTKYFLIF